MSELIRGIIGSLIAAGLIWMGVQLTSIFVPKETALLVTSNSIIVDDLTVWQLTLNNKSDYAIEVEFTTPQGEVIGYANEPELEGDDKKKGTLLKDSTMNILMLFKNQAALSQDHAAQWLSARYQATDPNTGIYRWHDARIIRGSTLPISRSLYVVFWFLLPFLVTGLGLAIYSRVSQRRSVPNTDRNNVEDDTEGGSES